MEPTNDTQSEAMPESAPIAPEGGSEPAGAEAVEGSIDTGDSENSSDRSDDRMPDASSLIAMAGMHMETQALIQVLLSVFHAHAWRSMGLVADYNGEVRKDMPSAQTAIDCLAFLLGKVEGTLEDAEKRDVQRRLMDLRMNYVAKMREE